MASPNQQLVVVSQMVEQQIAALEARLRRVEEQVGLPSPEREESEDRS